jgi:hypothetical protein
VKPGLAAHQHRPAGHADGAAVAAEDVVAPEAEPARDEAVEVWGADVRIAVGTDGVGPLVVREQEQDVGPPTRPRRAEGKVR